MADFGETMMALFGFNPAQGETLTPGRVPIAGRAPQSAAGADAAQAVSDVSGRPYSPEAADPSTPSPAGRVLARLRVPGMQNQRTAARGSTAPAGDGSFGSGLGSDLAAGIGAVKVGADKGSAFLQGFAGAAKNISERQAAAQKADAESKKANMELLKSVFDMKGKIEDRQQKAQENATSTARQDRQDAETKRWHDLMAPAYKEKGKTDADKELGPKDTILAEQRLQELSGYQPGTEAFSFLKPEEQERRKKLFTRLYQNHFSKPYDFDAEGLPVVAPKKGAGAAPAAAASAADSGDDDEEDATPATPQPPRRPADLGETPAPAAPAPPPQRGAAPAPIPPTPAPAAPADSGAAPPAPAAAAPQVWRKYKTTDGTVKLYNTATGESKLIDTGVTGPSFEEQQMMQGGN